MAIPVLLFIIHFATTIWKFDIMKGVRTLGLVLTPCHLKKGCSLFSSYTNRKMPHSSDTKIKNVAKLNQELFILLLPLLFTFHKAHLL